MQNVYEVRRPMQKLYCVIYFRIPFTVYFVGKNLSCYGGAPNTKLYLYRKEFTGVGYYFVEV